LEAIYSILIIFFAAQLLYATSMAVIYIASAPKPIAMAKTKDDGTVKLIGIFSLQV